MVEYRVMALATLQSEIEIAVTQHFYPGSDGWCYPVRPGVALVRIQYDADSYRIERRQSPNTAWFLLAEALVEEFDPATFENWATNWDLTQRV